MIAKTASQRRHQKNPADGQPNALKHQATALSSCACRIRRNRPAQLFPRDGYASIDSGMSKVFHIADTHQLKFSAEISTLQPGQVRSPLAVNQPFSGGNAFGDYSSPLLTQGRRMQGSLRYSFKLDFRSIDF